MKHPSQATLALHAGGDLGWIGALEDGAPPGGLRTSAARKWRRSASCARLCRSCAEIPEVPWNRMAAEMRANIRLGLAAGECVRVGADAPARCPLFTGARAALAMASVLALMVTGLVLERPAPADGEIERARWCRPRRMEFSGAPAIRLSA